MLKYQARTNLDDKEAHNDLVAPSDNIEKPKEDFVAPGAEMEKN